MIINTRVRSLVGDGYARGYGHRFTNDPADETRLYCHIYAEPLDLILIISERTPEIN